MSCSGGSSGAKRSSWGRGYSGAKTNSAPATTLNQIFLAGSFLAITANFLF